MSFDDDDDDEFGGDDLFSHPDLLASLEKVEREHKSVNVVKETNKTSESGAGNSIRSTGGGGGGYHHAVARPAIHARGRGRAPQSNHIARPTTSHLAPQPVHRNPQQTAVQLQPQPQPQPRLQSRAQPQPTRLALKPAPIPVPFQEEESDDDDYAMAMDVLVNEEGKYMVVPQVQQDRPIANLPKPVSSPSGPPQAPAPALVPVPAPVPISSDRQLGRSTSLNFDSQSQSLQRQRQQQQQQQQHPGSSSQAFNPQGAGGSQWKRTMSADQLARKQAIEKAVGSGSSAGAVASNAVAAQAVARPTVVNSGRPIDTSARVQPNVTNEAAAVNPGEAARLQAELEALRQKLRETELKAEEQVLAFKREAQKRHGEAVYVRTQLDEVTRKSEETISELKQNQLSAQEEVKRLQTEHKKQLDSVQSQHTFDVHNNKAHKFFPSQKTAGTGRMTPGRGSSQFPQPMAPFQTPSRSPGRSQRSPRSNRKWQAELMPPPPPPAFVDPNRFKTPGRAGTSQRKGKDRLDLKSAASPSFSNLQDSFHVDPNVELDRLSKRAKQTHVGSALPPFDEDERRGDVKSSPPYDGGFALDLDPMHYRPAQSDGPEQFQIERSDADLRGEVIHVLFEHAYVPADGEPERPHITTIQRLLNIQTAHILPDFEQDAYDTTCTGLWDAIGDNRLSAKETCAVLVENLVDAMVILCRCDLTLPMVAVMRLVVYMAHSLSLFDDLQERIASSIPGDQLIVIARYCKQDRPVQVGKTAGSKARTTNTVPAPTAKAAARNDDLNEIDTPEPVKVERVEIGRALIALASVLGVDLNPPSEVLSTFVSDLAGLQLLLKPDQPVDLVIDAIDLTLAFSSYPDFFRQLLVLPPANEARQSNSSDSTRPPLVELLCGYLRTRHPEANDTINNMIQLRVLCIFSTMCSVESDALTLLANSYFLVPTLISFLVDQSEKIWGVATSTELVEESLRLLIPALSLLHHLVFPPAFGPDIHDPSASTRTGVNLMERLAELLKTREFGSLHHSFYTALPRITYADIGEDWDGWDPEELKDMQDLAGDILEGLIDAPEEGDGILEMYRPVNEMEAGLRSADDQDVEIIESMGIDLGLEDETEARNLASPVEDQRQGR